MNSSFMLTNWASRILISSGLYKAIALGSSGGSISHLPSFGLLLISSLLLPLRSRSNNTSNISAASFSRRFAPLTVSAKGEIARCDKSRVAVDISRASIAERIGALLGIISIGRREYFGNSFQRWIYIELSEGPILSERAMVQVGSKSR